MPQLPFIEKDHSGIDYQGGSGIDVLASDFGVISEASFGQTLSQPGVIISSTNYGAGNYIVINHGNGLYTIYMHLQNNQLSGIAVGSNVTKGQVIAKIGMTGNAYGPHLHFQVANTGSSNTNYNLRQGANSYAVNPNSYLANTTGNQNTNDPLEVAYCTAINTGGADGGDISSSTDPEDLLYGEGSFGDGVGINSRERFDANSASITITLDKDNNVINKTIEAPTPIITYIDYRDSNNITVYGKSWFGKNSNPASTSTSGISAKVTVNKSVRTGSEQYNCRNNSWSIGNFSFGGKLVMLEILTIQL